MSDPLVQVLRGLSSSPDGVLFSQDVCVQYPHLAAEYKARFPHRIDLGTMAQRAKDGQYRKSAVAAGAATVVAEVHLMVNNCLAYNLGNAYLEDQAIRFRTQALAALDKHFRTTGDALAHLLHLLSKTDDGSIFAKDVCEEFPDLAAQYKSMFPVRTDLGAMQKKAMSGSYKTLRQVQTDLDVMVNNCLRFNGEATHLGRQARSFHSQARRSLEKYFSIDGGVESWTVVSSSSPPTPHELSTPTTASVAALPTSRKRGRAEDSNSDDVIVVCAGGEPLPAAAAPQRTTATTTATSWMTPDNLKNLIAALDRPQDNGMFTTAVAKAYPEIAEQYSRVCPAPMDLDLMRTKATRKQYTSVTQLLNDVTLIAKNCVTYNGVGHPLAESAASFLRDATAIIQYAQDHHGAINKLVPATMQTAAPAPAGTLSSGNAEQIVQQQDEIVPLDAVSATPAPTGPVDTAILPLTPDLTALVQPKEKVLVTPHVALLAHQLPMRIPNAIREYIITKHLHQLHHQHPLNSEGSEVHAATDNKDGNIEERSEHFFLPQGHPSTVANVVEAFIAALKQREIHLTNSADALVNTAKENHQSIATGESASPLKVEVSEASLLASSLPLDDATRALARTLECREHLAKAEGLMQLLANVFDAAFLNVLLYRNERHLVDSWVATKLEAGALEAHSNNNNYPWSRIAHVELFIRLLLHIPQLGAVTAALASSPQIGEGVRVLYRHAKEVPLDAATKGVVATICIPLVEDFLCYAESRWDELSERR
ncbi:Hypothetical protein, putative [Bodo saltans]|uniref:Bromo domain-containing protein n=1 Tax=Bodo saltans TaxID=75058 RepID=A0A0S4JMV7_BODSA|nr:Hypothetical protein, putative [Bodo saltans]|eukprot:CUG90450.1 Hypothetical protein, putative [Bodo saltans]